MAHLPAWALANTPSGTAKTVVLTNLLLELLDIFNGLFSENLHVFTFHWQQLEYININMLNRKWTSSKVMKTPVILSRFEEKDLKKMMDTGGRSQGVYERQKATNTSTAMLYQNIKTGLRMKGGEKNQEYQEMISNSLHIAVYCRYLRLHLILFRLAASWVRPSEACCACGGGEISPTPVKMPLNTLAIHTNQASSLEFARWCKLQISGVLKLAYLCVQRGLFQQCLDFLYYFCTIDMKVLPAARTWMQPRLPTWVGFTKSMRIATSLVWVYPSMAPQGTCLARHRFTVRTTLFCPPLARRMEMEQRISKECFPSCTVWNWHKKTLLFDACVSGSAERNPRTNTDLKQQLHEDLNYP